MVTKTASYQPSVGDHVLVSWGLEEVPGVVIDVYGTGVLARAMVHVAIPGAGDSDDGEAFSLPFGALRPE